MNCFGQKNMKPLFNGINFNGWEGDTLHTWHIEDSAIIGGSLHDTVAHNYFLCTKESFTSFHLRLRFKLLGTEGFINSGIQFNAKRLSDPPYEMTGYQADLGDGFWGSLYDESRRNITLTPIDSVLIKKIINKQQWNTYDIWSKNGRIQLFINGNKTADYTEQDASVPQQGIIGLQIHGYGKAEVQFRDIIIEVL